MRLYLTPTSPYARKVHIALLEKRVAFEAVYVTLGDPSLAALNPLGKVPTLVRADGRALYDSPVIVQYLERFGVPLIPEEGRIDALAWEALMDGLCDAVVASVIEKRRSSPDEGVMASQEGKARRALAVAEAWLGERAWAVGEGFSLGDVAIASALGYLDLRNPTLWRGQFPNLERHAAALAGRDSVARTGP